MYIRSLRYSPAQRTTHLSVNIAVTQRRNETAARDGTEVGDGGRDRRLDGSPEVDEIGEGIAQRLQLLVGDERLLGQALHIDARA
jgi:hypothetical protein